MLKKIFAFIFLSFAFTGTAFAQISIDLTDKRDSYLINPGSTLELDVQIRNSYRAPVTVAVYTVDGTTTSTGSFAAKQITDEQLFFGIWSSLDEKEITLEKSETRTLKMSVVVPDNATPGDYSGAIIVSKVLPPEEIESGAAGAAAGLNFTTRLARPIYISVAGERKSMANVGDITYKASADNQYSIYTQLENKGNTTVKFILSTEIGSMRGESKQMAPLTVRLFPGATSNGEIPLGKLDTLGSYDIKQNIRFFEQNLISGEEIELGNETRAVNITIIPWREIIAVLAVLALLIALLVWKKLHFKGMVKRSKKYTVKQGDTLMSVAKQNGINWKTLAKINHLKPPYDLSAGKSILVPGKK